MKAIVDAKTFSAALDNAIAVTKHAHTLLQDLVKIQFSEGKCTMSATDVKTWLTVEIPAEGDDFTYAFRYAKEAARLCHSYDGPLTIEMVDTGAGQGKKRLLLLSCGTRKASFEGFLQRERDIPKAPRMEAEETFTVNVASLLEQVSRIKYVTRKKRDTTYNDAPVCIQFDKDKLFCMDGYRVACVNDPGFMVHKPFLINPEALEYLKVFGEETVTVDVNYWYVRFSGNRTFIQCRRQNAAPFSLDRALPKEYREEFQFSPKEFLRELDYLKNLIPHGEKPYLRLCGSELAVDCGSQNGCTAIHIEGKSSIELWLDIRYMTDALKQFEKEPRVKLKIANSYMPVMLEAEGRSDYSLVLPVRRKELQTTA